MAGDVKNCHDMSKNNGTLPVHMSLVTFGSDYLTLLDISMSFIGRMTVTPLLQSLFCLPIILAPRYLRFFFLTFRRRCLSHLHGKFCLICKLVTVILNHSFRHIFSADSVKFARLSFFHISMLIFVSLTSSFLVALSCWFFHISQMIYVTFTWWLLSSYRNETGASYFMLIIQWNC